MDPENESELHAEHSTWPFTQAGELNMVPMLTTPLLVL